MVQTHINLWNEGKIDAVITGLGKVHDVIKEETQIPVYRNNVTAQVIQASIKRFIEKLKTSSLSEAELVEIVGNETLSGRGRPSKIYRMSILKD